MNIDFNTGKILLAKQFNGGLDHFFYDGPVLDWLPDKSGWLYQGHLVLDHQTGGEAWTFPSTDGQPRKVIRPNEMMVVFQTKQGKAFQTTPIPQAEIAKVLEFLRSGGHAIDAALPTVSTTDLFSATPVTLPNGFVQWSYSPIGGGTASPPRGIDRELLIGRDNEDLQRVIFAGKSSAKVVVQKEVRPKYNAGGGRHDRGQTVVERYDLVTGAKGATVEIPSFYGLVDSSPSGAFAVVGYSDSKSQADRIDVIGLNQRKHVAGFRPYFSEKENAEKKLFSANRNQVKWVGFLDDETLLTISTGGKLICWKVPECKGLYFFEDFGDPVAASPNRKFLAGVHHGEFRIFEALTGKCVGDLETPSSGVKTVRAAFRDDGRELAAIMDSGQDRILVRWNLTTGKIDQEFPIPPDAVPSHVFSFHGARVGIEYRGDDFLMLDDRYLIDLKKRCIVWSYQLPWGTFVNGSADHKTWYCIRKTKDSFSGPVFLTTHETPSAEALRRSTNVKLENSLILYPGKKVKLYVDLTGVGMGHMNSTAEKSIKECLIQRGFIVDPTAPLTFSVMAGQTSTGSLIGVHAGGGSRFGHSPFGREPQTTQEIIAQQALVCRLAVSDASEVLWSKDVTVAMRTSGNINSSNVSAELTKEMYDSFQLALENGTVGTIGVPTYLFRPLDRILGGESALVFGGERLLK